MEYKHTDTSADVCVDVELCTTLANLKCFCQRRWQEGVRRRRLISCCLGGSSAELQLDSFGRAGRNMPGSPRSCLKVSRLLRRPDEKP